MRAELVEAHDRFVQDYNAQSHFAHRRREDGRRSPGEVLSWVSRMRVHPKDLQRAYDRATPGQSDDRRSAPSR
jgi:hypothetical protein